MPNPNVSEAVTTAIQSRSKMLADNVSHNNALLKRLKEKGSMNPVTGGNVILEELEYAENQTYARYSGYEIIKISPSDVFTSAEFDWKQVSVAVTMSGLEEAQNSGKERMIPLLSKRVMNAEHSMANGMSGDVYSDGTADGGKQINGLQALVATAPDTGTVGGIPRGANEFWRNIAVDPAAALTKDTIKAAMQGLWVQLCRGVDKPDLIVADNNHYNLYWDSLTDLQRFGDNSRGKEGFGFEALKFNTGDVVLDGGQGGNMPSDRMYFLNTKYIKLRPHANRNMVPVGGERLMVNQDAFVKLILWYGNLTMSNASLQGTLGN